MTVDPLGRVVVPALKRIPGGPSQLALLRFNSQGEILDALPTSYTAQLATGQLSATNQPIIANVNYQVGSHYPLVRDTQGGTTRFLSGTPPFTSSQTLMAVRSVGERVTVLQTTTELARVLGASWLGLGQSSYLQSEALQGIRHANGAWAAQYAASNSFGYILNLDVPASGPNAPDGRSLRFVRSIDRVLDGDVWTDFGALPSSSSQHTDWRFASSGRAAFMMLSPRYTTPVRPPSPTNALTLWTVDTLGQLSIVARSLAPDEIAQSTMSPSVFRSLSPKSLALNTHGHVAFTSDQGPALDATPAPGIFLARDGVIERVLATGETINAGPGQDAASPAVIAAIPANCRLQLNDRSDLLATVSLANQPAQSVILRLAQPDIQSGLEGWIRVAGPGDRLLNAPRWRIVSIDGTTLSSSSLPSASLNRKGQVLLRATIEGDLALRTQAFISFDLQTGLNLVFADRQPVRDPLTQARAEFGFRLGEQFTTNWYPTNAGIAERFNDAGQFTTYAVKTIPPQSPSTASANTALLFTIKQSASRADLGSFDYPLLADGVLDNNDVAAFTTLYFDDSPRADVNEDGQLDGRDFARMIELFHEAQ